MIGTPAQDAFINDNKAAVVTTLRRDGSPASSIISFYRDGDDILFSTTAGRLKAKTIKRDGRVTVCVISQANTGYVSVEGKATIETDDLVRKHIELNKRMRGVAEFTPPAGFAEKLVADGRLIVRVRPTRVSGVTGR